MTNRCRTAWLFVGLIIIALLAACGGGGDDRDSVPAGAKVCELKQVTAGSLLPQYDVYPYESLKQPQVRPDGDDLFVVDYPFAPGSSPQLPNASLTFYVQQFGYRAQATTLLWECILHDLKAGDHVALRGGPRGGGGQFYIFALSEVKLADGKTAGSETMGFWINY